jgi:hypothetical protein
MKKTEKKLSQEFPVEELETPSVSDVVEKAVEEFVERGEKFSLEKSIVKEDFSFLDDGQNRIAIFYQKFADSTNGNQNYNNFLHIHKIRLVGEVLYKVEDIRHFLRKNAPIEVYVKDVNGTGKN